MNNGQYDSSWCVGHVVEQAKPRLVRLLTSTQDNKYPDPRDNLMSSMGRLEYDLRKSGMSDRQILNELEHLLACAIMVIKSLT